LLVDRAAAVRGVEESAPFGWFASATKPGFPVRVSLARTDPLMRPGLSVRVEVVRGKWEGALAGMHHVQTVQCEI
jgi:hypothetical protein